MARRDEPGADDDGGDATARQQPALEQRLHVDADGLEQTHHHPGEHDAAKCEQHAMNEEFAGKAHEVHAHRDRWPTTGSKGKADDQPERNRQMQRSELLRVCGGCHEMDVREHGSSNHRRDEHAQHGARGAARADKVQRDERQHEQPEVARVEDVVVLRAQAEQFWQLDCRRRKQRERRRDRRLTAPPHAAFTFRWHPLLKESLRMCLRECACRAVHVTLALERDQEDFIRVQARACKLRDLGAQARLESRNAVGCSSAVVLQCDAPLRNLCLDRVCCLFPCHAKPAPPQHCAVRTHSAGAMCAEYVVCCNGDPRGRGAVDYPSGTEA